MHTRLHLFRRGGKAGQAQDKTGQTQDKTGQAQDKTGQAQDRAGRSGSGIIRTPGQFPQPPRDRC